MAGSSRFFAIELDCKVSSKFCSGPVFSHGFCGLDDIDVELLLRFSVGAFKCSGSTSSSVSH